MSPLPYHQEPTPYAMPSLLSWTELDDHVELEIPPHLTKTIPGLAEVVGEDQSVVFKIELNDTRRQVVKRDDRWLI